MSDLRKQLQETMDTAEWAWLARHAERDAIILVDLELDLLDTAVCIARDEAAKVQGWISSGKLRKPTRVELDSWTERPDKKFCSVVVQPYVLVQELRELLN